MRIALLADVHANLDALSACLAHARNRGAQRFVFLGDLVGYGPEPSEVVEAIMALVERGAVAVLGNHDAAVAGADHRAMTLDARTALEWTRLVLKPGQIRFLASLPLEVEESGRLYVHANAWKPDGWEYIFGVVDADRSMRATPCFETFAGHVHQPALYHRTERGQTFGFAPVPGVPVPLGRRRRWLALPGSVGQPRDGILAACYAILDDAEEMLTFFRVPYDVAGTAAKIRKAGLPESVSLRLERGL